MSLLLDDLPYNKWLYPFTSTRSVVHLRIGILTIKEKWESVFGNNILLSSEIGDAVIDSEAIKVPGNFIPSAECLLSVKNKSFTPENAEGKYIDRPWHIFQVNDWALRQDFEIITRGRNSIDLNSTNQFTNQSAIFVEESANVHFAIINAEQGPVYIGKNAEIMEGCLIRGPFSLGENAVLKMGAKVYGATTIGPNCIAGGEIKNAVIMENSNKAHDGYLGDSVIGSWCNLGAGTSNSNLKNTAGTVKAWVNEQKAFAEAGARCGLLMGDYSRCAVNTTFNTGTVVGVACNIFGHSKPPKYIPDFSWGNDNYDFEKCLEDIHKWKELKGNKITPDEKNKLKCLFDKKQKL